MNESSRLTLMDALNEACAIKFKEVAFAECNRSLPTLQREGQYQPWHRFTLPLQGNWGQVIVRNGHYEELKIGVGGAIVFHPYCRHYQLEERQDGRCLAVVLRSNYLRLVYVENLLSKFEYHICDSLSSCVINAMATLGSLDNQKEKAAAALDLLPVVLKLIADDLRHSSGLYSGKAVDTWKQVADYVLENSLTPLSREEIAQHFRLSSGYVSKLFRRNVGITFNAYVTRMRLEHALDLLKNSNLTIGEIAAESSFNSPAYFIRTFRRFYSVSPSQYRHSCHNAANDEKLGQEKKRPV